MWSGRRGPGGSLAAADARHVRAASVQPSSTRSNHASAADKDAGTAAPGVRGGRRHCRAPRWSASPGRREVVILQRAGLHPDRLISRTLASTPTQAPAASCVRVPNRRGHFRMRLMRRVVRVQQPDYRQVLLLQLRRPARYGRGIGLAELVGGGGSTAVFHLYLANTHGFEFVHWHHLCIQTRYCSNKIKQTIKQLIGFIFLWFNYNFTFNHCSDVFPRLIVTGGNTTFKTLIIKVPALAFAANCIV